jgi:hypothetical protein
VLVLFIKIQQVGEAVSQRFWVLQWRGAMRCVTESPGDPFLRLQQILILLCVMSSKCWKHGSLVEKVLFFTVHCLLEQNFNVPIVIFFLL